MSKTTIKLGNTLTFDTEKEKDIIELVDKAREQHKLGEFISHLIRIYNEKPELLGESKSDIEREILKLESIGLTPSRQIYFQKVTREMEQMKNKVDKIYDMCIDMYSLARFGKHIGIEDKTTNCLMASFILEKQLNDICNNLGIDNINHVFNSNKIEEAKERSSNTLEYIIETYDGIITEIKRMAIKEVQVENSKSTFNIQDSNSSINEEGESIKEVTNEDDGKADGEDYVDFGDADMAALGHFFGE